MDRKQIRETAKNAGKLLLCFTALALVYTVYSALVKFFLGEMGFLICTTVIVVFGIIYLGYITARDENGKKEK